MARKQLVPIDMNKLEVQNQVVQNLASAPSSPVEGQIYYDTTLHQFGYRNNSTWVYAGSGSGDVSSNTSTSVDSEVVLFNGTTGKSVKRATGSGIAKLTSGVLGTATAGTDYVAATSGSAIQKANGAGGLTAAAAGTDYVGPTSGSAVQKANGSGGLTAATLTDLSATATAAFSMNTQRITNVVDPSSAQDAATKNYVDATAQGLDVKNSTVAATVGTETFTVTSGSVTQIAGTTLDGVSPAVGDRILIKDAPSATGTGSANSTQPGNGIYTVTSNTTNLSVSRATDQSGTNNPQGDFVFVEGGTTNGGAGYVVSTPSTTAAFTYGTNNIKWTQFSGAGEITAGTGITKSGNTLSITSAYAGNGIGTVNGLVKGNGSGTISAAAAGTDYAPATTGSAILKGNGSGGFSGAVSATDYAPATTGSSVLKASSGGFAAATASDIQAAGGTAKFTGLIGNASLTSIAVTHGLGTQYVVAQVFDASTNALVECDITLTSSTQTTFTFATAPASNAYRVVIVG